MGVGLHEIPKDRGGLADGHWHVCVDTPLNDSMGGVTFRDGKTVRPINGRRLRRIIAGMGNRVVWARRDEDGFAIGDHPGHRDTPPAPVAVVRAAPAVAPAVAPVADEDGLDGMTRTELRAYAREWGIDELVNLSLSADDLRDAIRKVQG